MCVCVPFCADCSDQCAIVLRLQLPKLTKARHHGLGARVVIVSIELMWTIEGNLIPEDDRLIREGGEGRGTKLDEQRQCRRKTHPSLFQFSRKIFKFCYI